MKHYFYSVIPVVVFLLGITSCSIQNKDISDYTQYVNPFIGTGDHGHTFPGAIVPHGMIQPSPDTRIYQWDACSGYHYSDSILIGFSHTHLSGTGCTDLGDILIMPLNEIRTPRGNQDDIRWTVSARLMLRVSLTRMRRQFRDIILYFSTVME